jgi:hypothetical protein
LLNAITIIEAWGLLNKKIQTIKKCAQNMGILHETIGQKKPHLPSHMSGVGVFFNISVNQIGHLQKLRVSEVRNCKAN